MERQSLSQLFDQAMKIYQEVALMLEAHDKLVSKNEQVIKTVMAYMDRFEKVVDATKVHNLRSERQSWITRQRLRSEAMIPLLTAMSQEMMNTGC